MFTLLIRGENIWKLQLIKIQFQLFCSLSLFVFTFIQIRCFSSSASLPLPKSRCSNKALCIPVSIPFPLSYWTEPKNAISCFKMRTIAVSFRVKSIYSQNNNIIIIGKHYKASAVATTLLLLYTVICSIPASEYHGKNPIWRRFTISLVRQI